MNSNRLIQIILRFSHGLNRFDASDVNDQTVSFHNGFNLRIPLLRYYEFKDIMHVNWPHFSLELDIQLSKHKQVGNCLFFPFSVAVFANIK